mmetsp:Transcript_164804/g.528772  ORF Transcript_164804/g.528772 Transcript_164804/m.528772 type:complete len:108 (-) Transcript_164804:1071-1394(-)
MCSLSSASGLQALLAEHRAQLGALAAAVDELRAGQQALAEAKRDASGTHANLAKDHRCLFRRHATLQDEHEASFLISEALSVQSGARAASPFSSRCSSPSTCSNASA